MRDEIRMPDNSDALIGTRFVAPDGSDDCAVGTLIGTRFVDPGGARPCAIMIQTYTAHPHAEGKMLITDCSVRQCTFSKHHLSIIWRAL